MIGNKSRRTAALQESRVKIDIQERGWIVMDAPAEAPYDLVVDMGFEHYGKRIFWSVQVKEDLRTTNRPIKKNMSLRDGDCNSMEPISKGGKGRNWYHYYDKDVTLLASYDEKLGRVKYIHKDQYKYCTPGELKKVNEFDYPVNELMYSYKKPTVFTAAKPTVKIPSITIENFL